MQRRVPDMLGFIAQMFCSWTYSIPVFSTLGYSALSQKWPLLTTSWASLVAQMVKNLPAIQETWVQFLGWEDPLEKGMVGNPLQSPAWRIPRTEKPGRLQSMVSQRVIYDWMTNTFSTTNHDVYIYISHIIYSNIYSYIIFI